jgi:hypothetical protein
MEATDLANSYVTIPEPVWSDLGKTRKISVRLALVSACIRTGDLMNKSKRHYSFSKFTRQGFCFMITNISVAWCRPVQC